MLTFLLSQFEFLLGILLIMFLIAVTLFITFRITRVLFRFIVRILLNSVLGFIALFILNLFGVNVPVTASVILAVALFGLPALATILILLFFGVKIS